MAFATAQSQVASALKGLDECPESVKQMFLTSLPNAFGQPGDLHQYQKEVGTMLRKTLEEARASASDGLEVQNAKVAEARTALEALQADVSSTQADEDSARAQLEGKNTLLEEAKETVTKEEALSTKTEVSKSQVTEEKQKLESAKAEVESVMNGSFQMLKNGGWDDDEVRDACIDAVCQYLQGGDVVLLAALPKALALTPDKRGTFDNITVEEASQTFLAKIDSLTRQLADGAEKFEDAEAEYLGSWAILDVARDDAKAASDARDVADRALQTATVQKKVATSKVMDQDKVLNELLSQAALIEAKVSLLDTALGAMCVLEAGEQVDAPADMEVEKDGKQDANVADKENAEGNAMTVDVLPLAVTA